MMKRRSADAIDPDAPPDALALEPLRPASMLEEPEPEDEPIAPEPLDPEDDPMLEPEPLDPEPEPVLEPDCDPDDPEPDPMLEPEPLDPEPDWPIDELPDEPELDPVVPCGAATAIEAARTIAAALIKPV